MRRESFHKWADAQGLYLSRVGTAEGESGGYTHRDTRLAWLAWLAAIEACAEREQP